MRNDAPPDAPSQADASNSLFRFAFQAHRAGRLGEARNAYLAVLAEDPQHSEALRLLAIVLHQSQATEAALTLARGAVSLRQDVLTWNTLGLIARESRCWEEAEKALTKAIEYAPDDAEILNDLGLTLSGARRFDDAETAYRRAIEIRPEYASAHNNLGVLLKRMGRLDEAAVAYRQALAENPDYPEAHNNIGVIFKENGRLDEAEIAYRRAIELKPDYADACWNLGLVLLTQGRYREAWPYYESRYHPNRSEGISRKPKLPFPQWQGEPIAGKSLILWTEQGHGDYVQFARYIPLLKQRGASHISVACPPPLKPLLATVSGVDEIITRSNDVPDHDYWVFPLSLPDLFGTTLDTLPANIPYLHALPERIAKWQGRLADPRPKIGLVWKGNPDHTNDRYRSLPHLSTLAPLWSVPDVIFFSLQKGRGEDEVDDSPETQPVTALGHAIEDFADTAAIVAQLDLVICVDTAIAHIAGALGTACWLLLPRIECDWRWLKNRSDSPWYPNGMRLFRQSSTDTWDDTIDEIATCLRVHQRDLAPHAQSV